VASSVPADSTDTSQIGLLAETSSAVRALTSTTWTVQVDCDGDGKGDAGEVAFETMCTTDQMSLVEYEGEGCDGKTTTIECSQGTSVGFKGVFESYGLTKLTDLRTEIDARGIWSIVSQNSEGPTAYIRGDASGPERGHIEDTTDVVTEQGEGTITQSGGLDCDVSEWIAN
jgi:hypothetical protein